jgi:hypothetical protein
MSLTETPRPNGRANGHANGAGGLRFPEERDSGEPGDRFTFVYPHQIQLKARLWLTASILPRYGFGVLFGPSGCGKSFWAVHLGLCVALGREFLGKATKQAGVIYVAAEDADGVQFRTVACLKEHGIERDESSPIPFAVIPQAPDLWSADEGDVDALIAAINAEAAVLREHGAAPGLIILDTMRDVLPGMNENGSDEMSRAVRTFRRIGEETGCLVLVVHHVPKGGDGEDPRGSTALIGAADVAFGVRLEEQKPEDEDAPPGPPERVLWMRKQRNGPDAKGDQSLRWAYTLQRVELDVVGEDGEPEASCAVRVTGAPAVKAKSASSRRLPGRAVIVLRAVEAMLSDHGTASPPGLRIPSWAVAVDANTVRDHAGKLGLCPAAQKDPTAALRVAFNRAKQDLIGRGKLHEMEGWLWLPRDH